MGEIDNTVEQKPPVIFLAFANDRVHHTSYLRNLPVEHRSIRNVLGKAKKRGLCDVVELANATINEILDVFQDETYKDRIAIFHYGGHANTYGFLLESLEGARVPAYKDGLVSFFARQKGLKLIFLNACSTEQHALELKEAGIPAVIGTSQEINDSVATTMAIRFYHGIANCLSLERAWQEAEDQIKIQYGSSNSNALYHWEKQEKHKDRFPWDIHFKEGTKEVRKWNLFDAANDLLPDLPPLSGTYKLPDKPFLFLNRYEREHAELFFGRSYYIRELYNWVTDRNSPSIILLYGQSGVGKSSLLEAGLLPRLEKSHTILYTRRLREKGLLGTLEETLNNKLLSLKKGVEHPTIGEKWKEIESQTGKPLIIILDQVEEVNTHINKKLPYEFELFNAVLETVFENPTTYPGGKLILSYRKEFHPEIEEKFKISELDLTTLFIQPLNRQDIVEVVSGLTRTKRLRAKYNLKVEKRLPIIIADNLLEDKDSPVAPTLQIVLTKMWDTSKKDESSPVRKFTVNQYQTLHRQGLLMEDFLKQQMAELRAWNPDVVDSGLALDVLKFHTTELGTACSRNFEKMRQRYRQSDNIINDLVRKLKDLYLLTDAPHNENETSLAHDTLAPIIIKEYNDSDKPGQRAARILAARVEDFRREENKIWLNEGDLEIVELGKNGMRVLGNDEERLVEISFKRKEERDKEKERIRKIRAALIFFVIVLAVAAAWQWRVASEGERVIRISKANYLGSLAQYKVEEDPTLALRLAEAALHLNKNDFTEETIYEIYRKNSFYKIIAEQNNAITSTAFSPDGQYILTGSTDKTARLLDLQGDELRVFRGHEDTVSSVAFSPNGRYILTGSFDRTARLWNLRGKEQRAFIGHGDEVYAAVFSPDGRYILTGSRDYTACLWDLEGNQRKIFNGHKDSIRSVVFSPNGQYILTASLDGTARLWDLEGNERWNFHSYKNIIHSAVFSPDGEYILAGSNDGLVQLWTVEGEKLLAFIGHEDRVEFVTFSPDAKYVLTGSRDKTARLWDLKGNELMVFIGHKDSITSAVFSPCGQCILTGSVDKTARLWALKINDPQDIKRENDIPLEDFLGNGICEKFSEKDLEQKSKR